MKVSAKAVGAEQFGEEANETHILDASLQDFDDEREALERDSEEM